MNPLPAAALLLTVALLLACGGTDGPRFATACIGVSCTAGYCVDDDGVASCRCGPAEQQQGLSCEIDEVGDLDSPTEPTLLQVPTAPTPARLSRKDIDTYAFEAVAGRAYRFSCTPQGFTTCALRPYAGSIDYSDPRWLTSAQLTREGSAFVSTFVAHMSGLVNVDVSGGPTNDVAVRGTYEYSLAEVPDAEPDSDQEARAVPVDGTPFSGTLDFVGDRDSFAFETQAGHVYAVSCTGQRVGVSVVAPDGTGLEETVLQSAHSFEAAVEVSVGGRHVARVSRYFEEGSGPYTCAVEHRGAEDHGDTLALATPLPTTPAQLVGTLEVKEDVDYFSFRALAGHAYELVCEPADQPACGSSSYIEIENRTIPAGLVTVKEDRTLGIRVSGGNANSTGSGRVGPYVLTLRDSGPDESSGPEDALPLTVGATLRGYCAPGDVDYFRMEAQPGQVYRARLSDTRVGYGRVSVFRLTELTRDLLSGAALTGAFFKVDAPEPLLVSVSSASGPYALTLEHLGPDDHPDVREAAVPLAGPALRAEGWVQTVSDEDWIALELEARPHAYRSGGGAVSVSLLEADGTTPVPRDWVTETYRPRAAGLHYVRVRKSTGSFTGPQPFVFELDPR